MTDSPSSLSVVIRRVHLGECPILAEIAKHANAAEPLLSVLGEMNGNGASVSASGAAGHIAPERPAIPNPLSKQESTIIAGVAIGAGSGEIAKRMGLKEQTVRNYVTEILRKLGARTRAQAAVIAAQNGWIESFYTTPI
jgi:DNA-binding NarL/FixJ family response regulator